ncbi:MAG: hypothetical protein D6773_14775, partial [Alphaproteobacteria bacterium]
MGRAMPKSVNERGRSFAALAHRLLMAKGQPPIKDLAEACGMSYANFYARLRGRTVFSADEIRRLFRALPD